MKNSLLAAIFLMFVARHYGYYLVDGNDRAQVWNISGAVMGLAILAAALRAWPSLVMLAIAAWAGFEEVQVIACSVAYMVNPWAITAGEDQCSSLLGFDLYSAGIVGITLIAWSLAVRSYSSDD